MIDTKNTINDRFKEVRKSLHLSQREFSAEIGFSQSTTTAIETGAREVQERHIKTICSIYGIDEHWLRTGEGEMFPERSVEDSIIDAYGKFFALGNNPTAATILLTLAEMTSEEWEWVAEFAEKLKRNRARVEAEEKKKAENTKKEEEEV